MTVRVRGALKPVGEALAPNLLTAMGRDLIGDAWPELLERGSFDLSRLIAGVRCRINVLRSARGVGFAIRLLTTFQATLHKLNLHPDLKRLVAPTNGLVIVTGATGSGKTSTLAALLQEINLGQARHLITIEQPIEYQLNPRLSLIRQREVGRDTPSFAQALVDALREDPDVLMVGEMREPEVMRLTLNAAETGHLVLATMHSSNCAEALQRVVSSFAPEVQSSVCAQLADCLVGVVAQRLAFRADPGIRVPEVELLMASTPTRATIRQGQFFKLQSALETGAADGSYTFERYGQWLNKKTDWQLPSSQPVESVEELARPAIAPMHPVRMPAAVATPAAVKRSTAPKPVSRPGADGVLELAEEDDPAAILRELEGN